MSSNAQATSHVGSKRNRRLRSNAGANAGGDTKRGKTKPDTSKVPIFLRKTYDMIDSCDPAIASWTEDGDMFVVKNQSIFEKTVIPKYFDHSKFSSFNRQLNFYGFRKIQAKPIRNEDIDQDTLKHITFYNENFKRGNRDLMIKIQRSTKTGGNLNAQEQQKEIEALKQKVVTLETQVHQLYQIISSGYAMNGAGPTATATATVTASGAGAGAAGGYGGVPMQVGGGGQPSPPAQEYYERPGSGHMSEENMNDNGGGGGGGGVPTSIAVHGQPPSFHPDHIMAPGRISSNGEVDRKQPPSTDSTMLTSIATSMNNNNNSATHHLTPPDKKATLPRHPNAKGGLPNDMPDLPDELERGVSSLSLLRGLSSGYDPNLSMGFLTRGVTLTGVSIAPPPNGNLKGGGGGPQGDTASGGSGSGGGARGGGGGGHDPNDPMLSNFDKKFFTTLINETSGGGGTIGDGGSGGSGGGRGIRVSNTAAGRRENDGESDSVGIKNDSMINSKQV